MIYEADRIGQDKLLIESRRDIVPDVHGGRGAVIKVNAPVTISDWSGAGAPFEKYNAQVQDTSPVTTSLPTAKTYNDETTKWQETAAAFEQLANDYSGYYGGIGRYYAGVAYLHLPDGRDKGVSLLKQVADKNDERASDLRVSTEAPTWPSRCSPRAGWSACST